MWHGRIRVPLVHRQVRDSQRPVLESWILAAGSLVEPSGRKAAIGRIVLRAQQNVALLIENGRITQAPPEAPLRRNDDRSSPQSRVRWMMRWAYSRDFYLNTSPA